MTANHGRPRLADPTPLALAGFSSAVLMVSAYYAGIIQGTNWVPPLGLIAGTCLMLGCLFHLCLGNTLPATNFGVYSAFWFSISIQMLASPGADFNDIMAYLRVPIAIYTLYAWVASLFVSKVSLFVFTTLEIKLLCFILGYFCKSTVVYRVGGAFGIACAAAGYYTSASLLLKEFVRLPLGRPLLKKREEPVLPVLEPAKLAKQLGADAGSSMASSNVSGGSSSDSLAQQELKQHKEAMLDWPAEARPTALSV